MEFFHEVNIDWLGKKWYFLGFSLIFSIAGLVSLFFWHGLPLGVDFKGGTLIYLKFEQAPNQGRIRSAADRAGLHDASIVRFGRPEEHEIIISLPERDTKETSLDAGRVAIVHTLQQNYASNEAANAGKLDLDNATVETLTDFLTKADPLHLANAAVEQVQYGQIADRILNYRDKVQHGLIGSFSELNGQVEPAVVSALQQGAYLSGFTVRNTEIVGPQVGAQLRQKALLATLYSLAGMLVYLWFRFELIYGVAAVVAVFHDTLITVGAFSLSNREMTLTVVAAILTLIGYSMNDTIVVFDRIRENLKLIRRGTLSEIVNKSINQTLSRTVLTSGLTFLTVLALFLFGGEVLNGFSFALVVGILIGTYSSIAVAAPMLVAYQDWRGKRGKIATLPAGKKVKA
ncbi:MAG TPA: protein translocase subunit SecF [Acidobacteriaceae bacterium]|nr:protein translocase subunit SecF [Acidobacteriaceae bacterium]